MSKKERITIRVDASTKHSVDKIPEDNSAWIRDVLERELNKRELMKDEMKKEAPAKIERLKELNSEINSLEEELTTRESRLKELRKAVDSLEGEISKKRGLKESIMEELEDSTGMDEIAIKGAIGDYK